MPRLTANPDAEASVAFDVVQPGKYRMRVKEINEADSKSTPGNKLWKVRLEYVDPTSLSKTDGTPAKNPGTIIDSSLVVYPPESQGKVRGFVEACGKSWGDIDSEDLIGLELTAQVGLKKTTPEYPEPANEVKRYIVEK